MRRDDERVDPVGAETYLRLLAESELRRPASSRRGPGAERIWLAATALIAVGGIDQEAAHHVLAEFEAAAALRGKAPGMPGTAGHYRPVSARPQSAVRPAGPSASLCTVPVGAALPLPPEREGWHGEFWLLALVIADGYAAVTVAARWAGQTRRSASGRPAHAPFHQVGAVDDQGRSYRASLWDRGLEDGREWWDGHLGLSPAPPAGTRWLDIGPGARGAHVRIDLDAHPAPAEVTAGPAPPASAAARLLDRAAEALLSAGRSAPMTGVNHRVAAVMQALAEGRAVPPGDPALARLAALGSALGLDLGQPGTDRASLPEAWASILAARGARDGPQAIAPFAVTLPELDGASFALAGLRSSREGATLHALARGWEPRSWGWLAFGHRLDDTPPDPSLSWLARDSTGRWHIAEQMVWGDGRNGTAQIQAYLIPPLHPAATSLEVILTGTSGRVRVTVPLHWQTPR
jgi:hypothetical protein